MSDDRFTVETFSTADGLYGWRCTCTSEDYYPTDALAEAGADYHLNVEHGYGYDPNVVQPVAPDAAFSGESWTTDVP